MLAQPAEAHPHCFAVAARRGHYDQPGHPATWDTLKCTYDLRMLTMHMGHTRKRMHAKNSYGRAQPALRSSITLQVHL